MIKVFFDASVLFSALYSSKGASAKLISLVENGHLRGFTTQTVIGELERNLKKMARKEEKDIHKFIYQNKLLVRSYVTLEEIVPYKGLVEEKDAHVLAGAILSQGDYLVTLDKKHLDNSKIKKKVKEVTIVSPRQLLEILTE